MAHVQKQSAGSEALSALVEKHKATKELAEKLGVNAYVVSRWANGWRVPPPKSRYVIEDECGIPFRAWDEPPAKDVA